MRDVISAEMWEAVNTTHLALAEGDLEGRMQMGPYSVFQYVKERSALFWGLTSRTMLRDEACAFLIAGGRIESADMVLRMLRVAMPARRPRPRGRPRPTRPPRRPGAGAAAGRRRLPGLPPRRALARRTPARSRASCSTSAPTRTPSPPPSTRVHARPERRRRGAAPLRAGAAAQPPRRRPRVPRPRGRRPDGEPGRDLRAGPGRARAGRRRHRRALLRRRRRRRPGLVLA